MSLGQQRMEEARSQIAAAEVILAEEHTHNLEQLLETGVEEGRKIESELKRVGALLVDARRESEPLWTKRLTVEKQRAELDAAFEEKVFVTAQETKAYEQRREEVTAQWHKLTGQIQPLSNLIGSFEHEYRQLEFAKSRTAGRVAELRQALRERRPPRF
jgi:chromosome segregation ATPase